MLKIQVTAIFLITLSFVTASAQSQDPPDPEELKRRIVKRYYDDVSDSARWEIKARYPELRLKGDRIAEGFSSEAKEKAMMHVADFKKRMGEMTKEDRDFLPKNTNFYLEVNYTIEHFDERFVSIRFLRSEYTGGAHPNSWSFTLNYDLKEEKSLALTDLFKPGSSFLKVISENSIAQIKKKQGEFYNSDWVTRGAGEKLENFKSWNLTKKGLSFTFDAYQVGSYAEGPYESLVPYEKFSRALRSDVFYPVSMVSYIDGNPPNWCRNGHFPQYGEYRIGYIKGKKNARAYYHRDDENCPDGANCRRRAYVIAGDEVIVARTYGEYSCVWYQPRKGSETVGWIKSVKISERAPIKPGRVSWLGEWNYYSNSIRFLRAKSRGDYMIKGDAIWKGVGDNVHIGELDFRGRPQKDKLEAGSGADKYDCRVKMRRIGRYLIVTDNKNCGGVNVSFDGVYTRKRGR